MRTYKGNPPVEYKHAYEVRHPLLMLVDLVSLVSPNLLSVIFLKLEDTSCLSKKH